jgi:hypothetical protein
MIRTIKNVSAFTKLKRKVGPRRLELVTSAV